MTSLHNDNGQSTRLHSHIMGCDTIWFCITKFWSNESNKETLLLGSCFMAKISYFDIHW